MRKFPNLTVLLNFPLHLCSNSCAIKFYIHIVHIVHIVLFSLRHFELIGLLLKMLALVSSNKQVETENLGRPAGHWPEWSVVATVFCRKTLDTAVSFANGDQGENPEDEIKRVHLAILGQSPSPLGQPQQLSSLRQSPVGQIANSVLRPTAFIACIHNHHPIHAFPPQLSDQSHTCKAQLVSAYYAKLRNLYGLLPIWMA